VELYGESSTLGVVNQWNLYLVYNAGNRAIWIRVARCSGLKSYLGKGEVGMLNHLARSLA
jgi:hypothetical protein